MRYVRLKVLLPVLRSSDRPASEIIPIPILEKS